MLSEVSDEAAATANDAAVHVCWDQWAAWGSLAATRAPDQTAIVDPEALVLLSLAVRPSERRLGDMVAWWARTSAHLMSVQRMKTLSRRLPVSIGEECLAEFSDLASDAGDRRWRRFARGQYPDWVRYERPDPEPDLLAPAALWPRLRAGFGVGAKADVLVFLLGLRGASATVPDISSATHYTKVSVRRAATDMSVARLLRETEGRPAAYLAPVWQWAELLELARGEDAGGPAHQAPLPRWRYWADVFAYLIWVRDWCERARLAEEREEHTMTSEARDIVKRHAQVFDLAGVAVPPMERFRGRDAGQGLLETTKAVASWMRG